MQQVAPAAGQLSWESGVGSQELGVPDYSELLTPNSQLLPKGFCVFADALDFFRAERRFECGHGGAAVLYFLKQRGAVERAGL